MQTAMIAGAGALILAGAAMGQTITQWNFNSLPPDTSNSSGSLLPSVGSGTASLVGGTVGSFASGAVDSGSSDPATSDDTAWNVTTFAAQGTGSGTRGVQFSFSTVGFENLVFSWDQRYSNTAPRHVQFQYSLDGSTFVNFGNLFADVQTNPVAWFNGRSIDLSSIPGANDNANFAVRLVAVFAPGTSEYAAVANGAIYGANGTWRLDMITLSGTTIAVIPLPPAAMAGLGTLVILGGIGGLHRRRTNPA